MSADSNSSRSSAAATRGSFEDPDRPVSVANVPGWTAKHRTAPRSSWARATVSMFWAALDTLYATLVESPPNSPRACKEIDPSRDDTLDDRGSLGASQGRQECLHEAERASHIHIKTVQNGSDVHARQRGGRCPLHRIVYQSGYGAPIKCGVQLWRDTFPHVVPDHLDP